MTEIKAKIEHGIACFTFDDQNFGGWLEALPLFEKYNAHATFFISGVIDGTALSAMTELKKAGHTIGLHTVHHADALQYFEQNGSQAYYENEILPQLSECVKAELFPRAFGYPNNRRSGQTDEFLNKYFVRFRAGVKDANEKEGFIPISSLGESTVMHGYGIGENYRTDEAELLQKLRYAAQTNTCVTFYSHNIAPNAGGINMPTELLELCLRECRKNGTLVMGFDEL